MRKVIVIAALVLSACNSAPAMPPAPQAAPTLILSCQTTDTIDERLSVGAKSGDVDSVLTRYRINEAAGSIEVWRSARQQFENPCAKKCPVEVRFDQFMWRYELADYTDGTTKGWVRINRETGELEGFSSRTEKFDDGSSMLTNVESNGACTKITEADLKSRF